MYLADRRKLLSLMFQERLQGINIKLIFFTMILASIGIANIHSATNGALTSTALIHTTLGFFVMMTWALMPTTWIMRMSIAFYLSGIAFLILVSFFGVSAKGAQRWLNLGIIRFQPSELMKLAVPMVLAFALHHLQERKAWLQFPLALAVLAVPCLLILKQPDLGTTILVATSGLLVIYLAGLPWKWIFGNLIVLALSAPLYWQYIMKDYQKERVYTLFDPYSDPLGKGYHIIQSIIAIGSGGVLGKGYQQGSQSQLDFLPEPHTDFIFAVLAEEWGFVGFLVLLVVNLMLARQCIKNCRKANTQFSRLLAGSLTFTYFIYLFVNIGMVNGILPVVGVPLPFISYGGSSAIITFSMIGIIIACGKPEKEAQYTRHLLY